MRVAGNYCWRGTSTGVDLNRNFDWCFGNKGSSGNRQDEEYRGDKPFSGTDNEPFFGAPMEEASEFPKLASASCQCFTSDHVILTAVNIFPQSLRRRCCWI